MGPTRSRGSLMPIRAEPAPGRAPGPSHELETAQRLGVRVTVVVWRDDGHGLIEWKQLNEFGRPFGVRFGNPDLVATPRTPG